MVSGSTGNKVEDYMGFYTKYGDGGVDAPIADLYKTEVWELGKFLGVDQLIVDALQPMVCDDKRTDEDQLAYTYEQLEEPWRMVVLVQV